MTTTQQLNPKLFPWLILLAIGVFILLVSSCSVSDPQPKPVFRAWEWAECLPSAAGYDCPGDKPLWDVYQELDIIVWRYEVEDRTVWTDEYGTVWRIYKTVYCLNAKGERVGTHHNLGFRGFQFRPDPITKELPYSDDIGVIDGTLCIFGVIKDGKVAPILW